MAKIPFDIKWKPQIESGEYKVIDQFGYVLTLRDIINDVWYFSLRYPNTDYETERIYDHPENHLFLITPESELTEFEKLVSDAVEYDTSIDSDEQVELVKKEYAAAFLKLAREELVKQGYVIFHDTVEKIDDKHKAEMSVEYSLHCKVENGTRHAVMNWNEFQKVAQHFINCGKAEALKDLPRWKKCAPYTIYNTKFNLVANGCGRYLMVDGYQINIDLLLEKLPGFKEDEK